MDGVDREVFFFGSGHVHVTISQLEFDDSPAFRAHKMRMVAARATDRLEMGVVFPEGSLDNEPAPFQLSQRPVHRSETDARIFFPDKRVHLVCIEVVVLLERLVDKPAPRGKFYLSDFSEFSNFPDFPASLRLPLCFRR